MRALTQDACIILLLSRVERAGEFPPGIEHLTGCTKHARRMHPALYKHRMVAEDQCAASTVHCQRSRAPCDSAIILR